MKKENNRNIHKQKAPLGASLVVVSSIFYASYGIWTTLMGNFFGGYTASALRSILVLVILVPIAFLYKQLGPVNLRRNWTSLTGLIASSLFVWGPLYYAVLHAGIGIALAVNYASIVIGMFFFGKLFAGERFTRDKLLSTVLGIIGLFFVFSPDISNLRWIALAAAVLSGLSCAANSVAAKKISYNPTQSTISVWVTSVVANIFMALLIGEKIPAIGLHIQWLYLVFFAIASVGASYTLIKGLKLIEAGAAGILGLLEIVFGVLFGLIFFGERIGGIVWVGLIIIIVSAAIPYIKDYNVKRGTL